MKTALRVACYVAALVGMTAASVWAFDGSEGNRYVREFDRTEGNHYILCLHPCPESGTWTVAGDLATARAYHTATLLPNGKVLVAGGVGFDGALDSAELYDPSSGTWSATGYLHSPRAQHAAVLLQNGKVLVAGNASPDDLTAELYDPDTGTWTRTGSLGAPHTTPTATLLDNGKVLVVGASADFDVARAAELYDPATGTWSSAGHPSWARNGHTATLLPDGHVLVAGGIVGPYDADIEWPAASNAELFDPSSNSWATVGALMIPGVTAGASMRSSGRTATLLPNGTVLIAGGWSVRRVYFPSCSTVRLCNVGVMYGADIYDPSTEAWNAISRLIAGRAGHTATLLADGRVLVAGGDFNAGAESELYDPVAQNWSAGSNMVMGRHGHTATLLRDGSVLVAGGVGRSGETEITLGSAELYQASP